MTRDFPRSPSRLLAATALALLVALSLAGCGGENEPTTSPGASSGPSDVDSETAPTDLPSSSDGGGGGGGSSDEPTDDGGEPSEEPSDEPSESSFSYDEAVGLIENAGEDEQTLKRFEAEDGLVYCLLGDRVIPPSCELSTGIEDAEVCADAPTDRVGRIELGARGAAPQCNTDTIRVPGAPTVDRFDVVSSPSGSVRCLVELEGVICVDDDSRSGFQLDAGSYRVTS